LSPAGNPDILLLVRGRCQLTFAGVVAVA